MNALHSSSRTAARQKPSKGEKSRARAMSSALAQLTPLPNPLPEKNELASPTPSIEPISAWELEAGSPRYQVPKFQRIAEISSDRTIKIPADAPMLISKSTGKRWTILKATAVPPSKTPRKFI